MRGPRRSGLVGEIGVAMDELPLAVGAAEDLGDAQAHGDGHRARP